MVIASKGFRRKTRRRLSRGLRDKFKPESFLKEFKTGERVVVRPDSISQKGMPFPRFMGKTGIVKGRRGRAYVLEVMTGGKARELQIRPEHLRRIE